MAVRIRQWTLDVHDLTGRKGFVVLADPEGNEFCVLRRAPGRG